MVGGVLLGGWYVGVLVALLVLPYRCGLNLRAYPGAWLHEPSRRNGVPWLFKTFVKAMLWPVVLWNWNQQGRPPSPVLYGDAAAEAMGIDPDSLSYLTYGFATKWVRPEEERAALVPPARRRLGGQSFPPTVFGYQPPPDAEVLGWECTNRECGRTDRADDLRYWPASCPECGSPVGSGVLAEPWERAAKRVAIDARIANPRDQWDREFALEEDRLWRYEEALGNGDLTTASSIRGEADRELRARPPGNPGGGVRWGLVATALDHDALDEAVAELGEWYATVDASDPENNSGNRANGRQLVSMSIRFLEHPGGATHPDASELREVLGELVYDLREVLTGDQTQAIRRLGIGQSGSSVPMPVPQLTRDPLEAFGRYEFLGADLSGMTSTDALEAVEQYRQGLYEGPKQEQGSIDALRRDAKAGPWQAIGAWKFAENFILNPQERAPELLDQALRAIDQFRVTNLQIHLNMSETERYEQLFGRRPPNDGFFGPPVFDSAFGPGKQHYFDAAVEASKGRLPTRTRHVPGVAPSGLTEVADSLWDLGRIVILGPALVEAERRVEPALVRGLCRAVDGADHKLAVKELIAICDADYQKMREVTWRFVGASRFIEDYLDASLSGSKPHAWIAEGGAKFLRERIIPNMATVDVLTPFERQIFDRGPADRGVS